MTPATPPKLGPPLLVDSHVHFHPGYDQRLFFDSAAANFAGALPGAVGCLMLTESAGADAFTRFRDGVGTPHAGGWQFQLTAEATSLLALNERGAAIVLIAGRQIVTRERLEILALGRHERYPDGNPVTHVIEDVYTAGGVPVLPWGFGKWWFGRGRVVRSLLESAIAGRLWLGDNAGRPAIAPESSIFALARRRGVPVLPGSDPLPMKDHSTRPGRYGFILDAELDSAHPARDLLTLLRTRIQPSHYGRRVSVIEFVKSRRTDGRAD